MNFKNISLIFIFTDFLLIGISLFFGEYWLINTQAGFIGAMLIFIGSSIGYKKMIDFRIENFDLSSLDERDDIDKITDSHSLYEEEDIKNSVIPKAKTSVENLKTSFPGLISPYRLGAYALFFIILFTLLKQKFFLPIPFVVGTSFACLAVLLFAILKDLRFFRTTP